MQIGSECGLQKPEELHERATEAGFAETKYPGGQDDDTELGHRPLFVTTLVANGGNTSVAEQLTAKHA